MNIHKIKAIYCRNGQANDCPVDDLNYYCLPSIVCPVAFGLNLWSLSYGILAMTQDKSSWNYTSWRRRNSLYHCSFEHHPWSVQSQSIYISQIKKRHHKYYTTIAFENSKTNVLLKIFEPFAPNNINNMVSVKFFFFKSLHPSIFVVPFCANSRY